MGECGSGSCSLHERKEAGSEEGIRDKVCAQKMGFPFSIFQIFYHLPRECHQPRAKFSVNECLGEICYIQP